MLIIDIERQIRYMFMLDIERQIETYISFLYRKIDKNICLLIYQIQKNRQKYEFVNRQRKKDNKIFIQAYIDIWTIRIR